MLRPSARIANAVALAAASMSPSFPSINGKRIAARKSTSPTLSCHSSLSIRSQMPVMPLRRVSAGAVMRVRSRFGGGGAAHEAGWSEHQHQHEDREDDHVGPTHLEVLAAQRFDKADQNSAEHGTRDVADAPQHRRGEGAKPRGVADDEARVIVVEAEDQARCARERRTQEEG